MEQKHTRETRSNSADSQSNASELTLELTDIAHGGVSVGRAADGRVVFVRGGIPGELVRGRVYEAKQRLLKAVVTQVLRESAHRVTHPWPAGAAGASGAADFGHIDLDWQRELKGQVLATQVQRVGGPALTEQLADYSLRPVSMDPAGEADAGAAAGWQTRTRFDVIKMPHGVGMYHEHSHELIAITEMPLAVPAIGAADAQRLDIFSGAWDDLIAPGTRMHVVSPASGADVVAAPDFVYTRGAAAPAGELDPWLHELRAAPKPYLHERASDGVTVYDYDVSPLGFWQVHWAAPSTLLRRVLAGLQLAGGERVLELFAGAGLFSVPIAQQIGARGKLLTIEGSETAVADARRNVARWSWAQPWQGWINGREVQKALAALRPQVVLADPPRAGLGVDAARAIAADRGVQRVVLVSCDPAAMARDNGALVTGGFTVTDFVAVDIFPHTHHIETVCVLERAVA